VAKYTVIIIPAARRDIKKLDKKLQEITYEALKTLESNPRPHGSEQLHGELKLFRKWPYTKDHRIIYEVVDKEITVTVVKVGDRKDIYRLEKNKRSL